MPAARGAMAAAALDGKLFVVGGVGTEGLANELYVYDTAADHWEPGAAAAVPGSASSLGDRSPRSRDGGRPDTAAPLRPSPDDDIKYRGQDETE